MYVSLSCLKQDMKSEDHTPDKGRTWLDANCWATVWFSSAEYRGLHHGRHWSSSRSDRACSILPLQDTFSASLSAIRTMLKQRVATELPYCSTLQS